MWHKIWSIKAKVGIFQNWAIDTVIKHSHSGFVWSKLHLPTLFGYKVMNTCVVYFLMYFYVFYSLFLPVSQFHICWLWPSCHQLVSTAFPARKQNKPEAFVIGPVNSFYHDMIYSMQQQLFYDLFPSVYMFTNVWWRKNSKHDEMYGKRQLRDPRKFGPFLTNVLCHNFCGYNVSKSIHFWKGN